MNDNLYQTRTISTRVVIDMESMQVVERDSYQYKGPMALAAGVVGMGLSNPPVTLVNTLNSITQKYIIPTLGDVVFIPSPAFWALTREGKKFAGGEIVYPEVTQEEMTGGAYYGDQLLDTAVVDSVVPANQLWRFYRQSLAVPITDIILNRGGSGGLDLLKTKFEIASASFLQKLCRALWGTSPQNTSLDIDCITSWVVSTTNTIAGINRNLAANAFWKPQANVALGGAITPALLEPGYATAVFGYDEPDTLLMNNTCYGVFKNTFLASASNASGIIRSFDNFQDKSALQVGARYHFLYNNATVIPDRFNPSTYVHLLNSKYLYPVFHEADYFTVDPFIKPSNQRVLVSSIYMAWQLICRSPRMQVGFTGAPA